MREEQQAAIRQALQAVLEAKTIPCLLSADTDADGDTAFSFRSFSPSAKDHVAERSGGGYFLVRSGREAFRLNCLIPAIYGTEDTSAKEDLAAFSAALLEAGNSAGGFFKFRSGGLDVRVSRVVLLPCSAESLQLMVRDSLRAALGAFFHWKLLMWSRIARDVLGDDAETRIRQLTILINVFVGEDPIELSGAVI